MSKSKIEWTDVVWNPVAGCSKVSAGCKHCYAERMAARCVAMGVEKYVGTVDGAGRWTGKVNFDEKALLAPLGWRKPRMVFVNSMSDLFHPEVPFEWVDRVFAVMALCPQHVFQVLTKRPERMAAYLVSPFRAGDEIHDAISDIQAARMTESEHWSADHDVPAWPLPNVWLGASVENQAMADERVPVLLGCPAAVRFLSCEPLLGAVDLSAWLVERKRTHMAVSVAGALRNKAFYGFTDGSGKLMSKAAAKAELLRLQAHGVEVIPMDGCDDFDPKEGCRGHAEPRLDWVICGGESGVGSGIRPMHPDWARGLRDQCVGSGVPFFFKQWGEWAPDCLHEGPACRAIPRPEPGKPGCMFHCGKKRAGRVLDGRVWDGMPGQLIVDS